MADTTIDLTAERNRRAEPDAEYIRRDDCGRRLYLYCGSYDFEGAEWGFSVWAYDMDEARRRIETIRENGRLDGQVFTMPPA